MADVLNGGLTNMSRFDIYPNNGISKKTTPFLLESQNNSVSALATRVVIPLRTRETFGSLSIPGDLFPIIKVLNVDYVLDTPQLASIPASELKQPVASAKKYQDEIQAALVRLFGGH